MFISRLIHDMQNIYDAPVINCISKKAALNQQILRDYHKQLKEFKKREKRKTKGIYLASGKHK